MKLSERGFSIFKPSFYFSPDEPPAGEPVVEVDELEAAKAEIAAEKEAEEARLKAEAEGAGADEEKEARETAEQESAEAAEAAKAAALEEAKKSDPKPLTDEELKAEAIRRGFIKPDAPAADWTAPPEIADYRTPAYAAAWNYPEFVEQDEVGNKFLTQKGIDWAENKAIQDGIDARMLETRNVEATRNLQAQKPALITQYTEEAKKIGIPDDIAPEVAKDFTEIMVNYGLSAFDEGEHETDPKIKETKQATSAGLRKTAYLVALGLQKEREIVAAKEGGAKGDKPVGGVDRGGEGGSLYAGLDKDDENWLKNEWAVKKNGGKPPTREQIKALQAEGVI